jgi:hypothetical protein
MAGMSFQFTTSRLMVAVSLIAVSLAAWAAIVRGSHGPHLFVVGDAAIVLPRLAVGFLRDARSVVIMGLAGLGMMTVVLLVVWCATLISV